MVKMVMDCGSAPQPVSLRTPHCRAGEGMITQHIVRKLWDEAGNGNVAVWGDGSMTVVPPDFGGEVAGRRPLVVLRPIRLVNEFELLDFALNDDGLLSTIEAEVRAAGGTIERAPQAEPSGRNGYPA